MIKNIVFDLGNVLLDFEPLRYLKDNIVDDHVVEEIYTHLFRGKEWKKLDRGIITEEQALITIGERIPERKELVSNILEDWNRILKPISETVAILESVKEKGYNTWILSNFPEKAFKEVQKKYDFFKLFDGGIVSYDVGLLKPETQIYLVLIDKYKINPEESIFIDDMEENILEAEKLGFKTIQFQDTQQLIDNLKKLDII